MEGEPEKVFHVKISEILELQNWIREFNGYKLDEIEFLDENENPIEISENVINEFKMTGFSNMDFISSGAYKAEKSMWNKPKPEQKQEEETPKYTHGPDCPCQFCSDDRKEKQKQQKKAQ